MSSKAWPCLALTEFYQGDKKIPRARSEKDITRVSGTLSTGSIPVGRAISFRQLETSLDKVSAKVSVAQRKPVTARRRHRGCTFRSALESWRYWFRSALQSTSDYSPRSTQR